MDLDSIFCIRIKRKDEGWERWYPRNGRFEKNPFISGHPLSKMSLEEMLSTINSGEVRLTNISVRGTLIISYEEV